ncbi:hypothetical protein ACERK3_07660 [Phycisphaerales bacterium AB-hyl4]|uniref:VWFA domain-containing protein n=1 Tax=Natronomicrosphaera hydrolytica TaxID=3242702 RepID=A0ABV4U3J4_9BACT
MSTLELECPGCDQVLELDAGFAGGVCRCSNCGTLMTVPVEAGQTAEVVKQRQRPARPDRPMTPGEAEAAAKADEQVYTTTSGREVRVGKTSIPTAQQKKRLMVRTATAVGFISVLAGVLALAGMGVWMLSQAQREAGERTVIEAFEYSPGANPYDQRLANVLGLPLAERVVVVVDASASSEVWLDEVNAAIGAGLTETSSASEVVLVYTNGDGLHMHPSQPRAVARWRADQLIAFQQGVSTAGEGWLDEAVARGMQWLPRQMVLVVGREPSEGELVALERAFEADAAAKLDVVAVDFDSAALDDLTGTYGGRYVPMTREQLVRWRER